MQKLRRNYAEITQKLRKNYADYNTIKSLSLSCRLVLFLSIVKTIRSERAEGFSLRQGVWFTMDANEGDAPVRKITNGQKSKTLFPASTEEL